MNSCGLVLLAAGSSSRMGQPKQLLSYEGKSLLQHSVQTAVQSIARPVIVVVGADADRMQQELNNIPVQVVYNEQWGEGMASSIRCGLSRLLTIAPGIDSVVFTVCDQPFLSASLLNTLIAKHMETGKDIVASAYSETAGVPVVFSKVFFSDLLRLRGNEGAKKIIRQHPNAVATVAFPMGDIDMDTPQDYENLQQDKFEINNNKDEPY